MRSQRLQRSEERLGREAWPGQACSGMTVTTLADLSETLSLRVETLSVLCQVAAGLAVS